MALPWRQKREVRGDVLSWHGGGGQLREHPAVGTRWVTAAGGVVDVRLSTQKHVPSFWSCAFSWKKGPQCHFRLQKISREREMQ